MISLHSGERYSHYNQVRDSFNGFDDDDNNEPHELELPNQEQTGI